MLDWLESEAVSQSKVAADIVPVSRFCETPENPNRDTENPHQHCVSPVSRLSRFENEGVSLRNDGGGYQEPVEDSERGHFPTLEEVEELDRLIVRLCDLVPWLSGFLPEIQAARRRMAPSGVAQELVKFRRWVAASEQREEQGAGRMGAASG